MKKVASACLCLTLHFVLDRSLSREAALEKIRQEVLEYKKSMTDDQIIASESRLADGSVALYVRKKVKDIPIGSYFEKKII